MTKLSRRGLLKTGAAAGVLGALGPQAFAASHATPKRGGKLTAGLGGANTSDSWDGRTHSDIFMIAAASGTVFDS